MKTCSKCKKSLPSTPEHFIRCKKSKDGLFSHCKECNRARYKKYHQENIEHEKQRNKQYRQENAESIKQRNKQYYQENAESEKQRRKQYYQENIEQQKQYDKQYKKINAEKIKQYRQSEHGKEIKKLYHQKNAESIKRKIKEYRQSERGKAAYYKARLKRKSYKYKVKFTSHERKQILDRDNWTCQSCEIKVHDRNTGDWNTPDKAHIDHIIPISKGGNSEPKNLRVLCRTCNISKHDKLDEQLNLSI